MMVMMLAGHSLTVRSRSILLIPHAHPSTIHPSIHPSIHLKAMVQRLAEKYVGELSEMAKHSNLVKGHSN